MNWMHRQTLLLRCCLAAAATAVAAGCVQLETTASGNPERVLTGAINFNTSIPVGAEIVVRVLEPLRNELPRTVETNVPVTSQPTVQRTERVLGELRKVVLEATMQPVPFAVEYRAEDALLRRGLNVDVRVTFGGKVRLRTIHAHVVTLASSPFKQEVWVQPLQ